MFYNMLYLLCFITCYVMLCYITCYVCHVIFMLCYITCNVYVILQNMLCYVMLLTC